MGGDGGRDAVPKLLSWHRPIIKDVQRFFEATATLGYLSVDDCLILLQQQGLYDIPEAAR